MRLPNTGKGVLIALGLLGIAVVYVYATTILTVVIGAVVIAAVLYAVYVILYRLNRLLRDKRVLGGGQR